MLYFFICIVATTMGAISGMGGGIIIKPVLDAVSGIPVASISFLSSCTVLAMGTVSLLRSRNGDAKIELSQGTWLAVGAALGGVIGKALFDAVCRFAANDSLIGTVQNAVMVLLTAGVFLYILRRAHIQTLLITSSFSCVLIGLLLGIISSFLGIGGGPINLVVLYYFFSMDAKVAALNSLYIIFFSQIASLASTMFQGQVPPFDPFVMCMMVLGGIAGGFIGSSLSLKLHAKQVELIFYILLVIIGAISTYNLYQYLSLGVIRG